MPQSRPSNTTIQNNFSKGLITEATGLTFPENAATDTENCVFSRLGRVTRRLGVDYEAHHTTVSSLTRASKAVTTYKWTNAGGDGNSMILVHQIGAILYFYLYSSATASAPISSTKLASTVDVSTFLASGGSFDATKECTYAHGNGYLIVYHPDCDTSYCLYSGGTVTAFVIDVKIRDFTGVIDAGDVNTRPKALTAVHNYSLHNQGWWDRDGWASSSTTTNTIIGTGNVTWFIETGLTISVNDVVNITTTNSGSGVPVVSTFSGLVVSYNTGTGAIVINVTGLTSGVINASNWTFNHPAVSSVATFQTAAALYPSNSDVWWRFKNSTNIFDVAATLTSVEKNISPAPKGHYILSAFNQQRTSVSGIAGMTAVTTTARPKHGTWFAGRVWYAGVDAASASSGTAAYSTWTENVYFSQIVENAEQFGKCYQTDDPTSEDLFDLLPSDGGVVRIQGCGSIYKLFPIQNGLLVFAANGIWFITGSQGVGFTANDYTVTRLSSIQSISGTSFVDVNGFPVWWNEEGIYVVTAGQNGLDVQSMSLTTISSFYEDIPLTSKRYARGDYNPLTYTVQWIYKTTQETSSTDRYAFDGILNFNQAIQGFFPWVVSTGTPKISGINYIAGPGGSTTPDPTFKYLTSTLNGSTYDWTFSEEYRTDHKDWVTFDTTGVDYSSFFVTGYQVHAQAMRKFQQNYVTVFSDSAEDTSFKIQAQWDYATLSASGQWSTSQVFFPQTASSNANINYAYVAKRIKIRGKGRACQFRISNNGSQPFSIIGWAAFETMNRMI